MSNPNWIDLWTADDLTDLFRKRIVERKKWHVISTELGKPLTSCIRRFGELPAVIEMRAAPKIEAPASPVSPTLHDELGISTYTHRQAVTDYVGGFNQVTGQYFSPHEYRARVTLAKVFA